MAKYCDNCGALLRDSAKFCTKCGTDVFEPVTAAFEQPTFDLPTFDQPAVPGQKIETPNAANDLKFKKIREKYNPLWLILIVFLTVCLFGLPESLLKTGLPPLLESLWVWLSVFVIFCVIAWLYFFLAKKKELKALGVKIDDLIPAGKDASSTRIKTRWPLLFATLAVLAGLGLSLFSPSFKPGIPINTTPTSINPSSSNNNIETVETTQVGIQVPDGVWLPSSATLSARSNNITVSAMVMPSMVTYMPAVYFVNGKMFMGYGDDASSIYESSCLDHSAVAGYDGYPVSYADGIITVSDPYSSTPDRQWRMDEELNIWTDDGAKPTFVPTSGSKIINIG